MAPTVPTVAFKFGARHPGSRGDVPVRRLHAARQRGRSARPIGAVRLVGGPARGPSIHRQALGRSTLFELGRAYEAITRDDGWRSIEPRDLPLLEDASTPSAPERAAAAMRAA